MKRHPIAPSLALLRRPIHVFAVALFAVCLSACGSSGASSGSHQIVAAEDFYGSIAGQIGGPGIEVTSIIKDPSADPHQFSANTQETQAIADAALVIVNGAGYDAFMEKLLAASSRPHRTVIHVDRLVGAAAGNDPNPHLWYDPRTPYKLARAIADELSRTDPGHAVAYQRNLTRFIASLAPISAEIASLQKRFAGAPFAYSERVPAYLTSKIGLALKTPDAFSKANEAGTDPSPQSVATMRALIAGHRIRLLLYNAQASSQASASIRDFAGSKGIPVVGISETSPPGKTYQEWQLGQLRQIDMALSRR